MKILYGSYVVKVRKISKERIEQDLLDSKAPMTKARGLIRPLCSVQLAYRARPYID